MLSIGTQRFFPFKKRVIVPGDLYDGNTWGWYKYDDINTLTLLGAAVNQWRDKSVNARHLSPGLAPTWTANGISFNGASYLETGAVGLNQPETIYIVINPTAWIATKNFFDGSFVSAGLVQQFGASPGIIAFAGSISPTDNNCTLNNYHIVKVIFNGAASELRVDQKAPNNGNFGASNMGGFTIGSAAGGVNPFTGLIKEAIVRTASDSAAVQARIYKYLSQQYGIAG
jgi:hypothetical protein